MELAMHFLETNFLKVLPILHQILLNGKKISWFAILIRKLILILLDLIPLFLAEYSNIPSVVPTSITRRLWTPFIVFPTVKMH